MFLLKVIKVVGMSQVVSFEKDVSRKGHARAINEP